MARTDLRMGRAPRALLDWFARGGDRPQRDDPPETPFMKLRSRLGLAALLSALATASPAALLTTHYAHVSGTSWTVDLALTNDDGTPPAIEAFTAYFDEAWFANLQLLASPAGWDTIAVQPSTTIPAAGFIDALVMDPAHALGLGDQAGGFRVRFDFLGSDAPGALAFDVHDPLTFDVITSGTSVDLPAPTVPEPASAWLAFIALAAAAGAARRQAGGAR
jgi:hypothetical protein